MNKLISFKHFFSNCSVNKTNKTVFYSYLKITYKVLVCDLDGRSYSFVEKHLRHNNMVAYH